MASGLFIISSQTSGAEQAAERNPDEIVVTATRTKTPISQATRSVTVLDRDRIEQQSAINQDLGDILAKEVPGFGTSTGGLTNFTQNLRGRPFLVMIDGIPVSTPLIGGSRDLKIIDSSSLERVEVLRGGTAAYGFGATGGLVHYITRDPRDEAITGFSKAGFSLSTEHVDDSLRWHTAHGASGQAGPIDFLINGSFTQRDSFFDADGDRIPSDPLSNQGGFADTDEWNILGKIGFDFDSDRQRFELMLNNYDIEQDTDFVTVPGNVATGRKATAIPGLPVGNQTKTENMFANVSYEHQDVLGSSVSLQAYYLDYLASFPAVAFFGTNAGSINEIDRIGTRLTIDTPLWPDTLGATLTWGLDYLNEDNSEIITGDNGFATPDLRDIEQDALAGFAQLTLPVGNFGQIRAGIRHEEIDINIPTIPAVTGAFGAGNTIPGGELSFNATLFNITGVYFLTDEMELFGGFSQGFSVEDLSSALQGAGANFGAGGSVTTIETEALEVDNYEIGLRGDWDKVRGSVVGFISESDFGVTRQIFAQVTRQPEEIRGIELSFEADVHSQWTVGGTATWLESEADLDGDGNLDEELPTRRVPPDKFTAFVEYDPLDWWTNRLQLLYSGTREPDGATNFAGAPDEVDDSFTIVDYYASLKVGAGDLQVGVNNLLNEDYFPVAAQAFGTAGAFTRGEGRSVSISYGILW